jgi:hypothetical protein
MDGDKGLGAGFKEGSTDQSMNRGEAQAQRGGEHAVAGIAVDPQQLRVDFHGRRPAEQGAAKRLLQLTQRGHGRH